jgi:hypothetical protein
LGLFGTGISPSLYGSFYAEGGLIGLVVLSFVYGYLFSLFAAWSHLYVPNVRWMLRGIFVASLLVIIRGGDLPGIAAFIGMSYWPVALFLWGLGKHSRLPAAAIREDSFRAQPPGLVQATSGILYQAGQVGENRGFSASDGFCPADRRS